MPGLPEHQRSRRGPGWQAKYRACLLSRARPACKLTDLGADGRAIHEPRDFLVGPGPAHLLRRTGDRRFRLGRRWTARHIHGGGAAPKRTWPLSRSQGLDSRRLKGLSPPGVTDDPNLAVSARRRVFFQISPYLSLKRRVLQRFVKLFFSHARRRDSVGAD